MCLYNATGFILTLYNQKKMILTLWALKKALLAQGTALRSVAPEPLCQKKDFRHAEANSKSLTSFAVKEAVTD